MRTIEERAKEYGKSKGDISLSEVYNQALAEIYEEAYKAGATEQKEIDEEVRLRKCDDMTEAEYKREEAFALWYTKQGKGTPTFSDAIEWARKETIDNACKCFCKTCRGQCKDNSHCDVFQVFRNELNAMEG